MKEKSINSKSGFVDPLKSKNQRPEYTPIDGKNSPWDFRGPQYDQRHSNFIKAGTNYGVGHRQPVGHHGDAKANVPVLPYGRVNTMTIDET